MNFDDFYNRNNGKFLDFDGWYGAQCVDLVQFWSQALGGPRFTGDAKDIAGQTHGFYTWIANSPTAVPQKGDIVVWDGGYNGGPGHVAIATGWGSTSIFEVFEQNNPTGSNAHLGRHNYNHVAGWLHKEGVNEVPVNRGDITNVYREAILRDPNDNDFAAWDGKDWKPFVYDLISRGDFVKKRFEAADASFKDTFDRLQATERERDDLKAKVDDLTAKLNNSGGVDSETKAQITETNNIVKQIWSKITSIFK